MNYKELKAKFLELGDLAFMSWKSKRNNPELFPSLERFYLSLFDGDGAKFELALNMSGPLKSKVHFWEQPVTTGSRLRQRGDLSV